MDAKITDIDALYQLPLAEFTPARNALAGRLKKGGKKDEADRIKGLTKPSIPAWAINQLYWKHRPAWDRLMTAGEQFRRAQVAQLSGRSAEIRGPLEARREALAKLSQLAAGILTKGGHQPTPEMMRRITTSLEALATYGAEATAPSAGRLADDVEPPGFETLASLVPTVGGSSKRGDTPTTIIPFTPKAPRTPKRKVDGADPKALEREREEQRKAHKAAVQAAERALREARDAAVRAEAALKKAAARVKAAEDAKAEAEARLEAATAAANEAKGAARKVAAEAEEAAQAVTDAERSLEKLEAAPAP